MNLYAELHANGQFGDVGCNRLFELTRQELRLFPDLRAAISDDAVIWGYVAEFLLERGAKVVTKLLTSASDEEAMSRLLRTSLRHWLIDQVRKTARGALRRRLERLVSDDDRFEVVPEGEPGAGRWRLADGNGSPVGPALTTLCSAAWAVTDVRVPPWNSEERRGPAADEPSLRRIMLAVLTAADGSLEPATIVTVFGDRLPHALDPTEEPLTGDFPDPVGPDGHDPARALVEQERSSRAAGLARDLYAQMSVDERRLLPSLHGSIGEQMKITRRGKSQTYLRVCALKERLRALLGGEEEEDRSLVISELLRICSTSVDGLPDGRDDLASIPGRQ